MSGADLNKEPEVVATMFDHVARRYDRANTLLSAGNDVLWRIQTVRAIAPVRGERILDIAAGTGTSSAAIAKSGAEVVALDFSEGMIEEGKKRHPNLEFVQGDALDLPFKSGTFDAVTVSFGLRNFEDPRKGLKEMHRVLKPGGRVVICEFSKPPRAILKASYGFYLQHVMPKIVGLAGLNNGAYGYLAESIDEWPDQLTVCQWMRGAGFTRVAYRNLSYGIVALHRGHKPDRKPRIAGLSRKAAS
ncbi:MAG: bifunctional demethylmenaquinone methyltransferase/2-methoxy-6-polyprenyl-1,4-benzoquinol methylase UbiE [Microbacteriaceae bacterium]|nr:bifunctional demethylmenaquinone methyltransferase/2-methoxy-6-polyprenyl-1,4-benzoquinol methylase UbiE [Microbacteriaceae bacterium]